MLKMFRCFGGQPTHVQSGQHLPTHIAQEASAVPPPTTSRPRTTLRANEFSERNELPVLTGHRSAETPVIKHAKVFRQPEIDNSGTIEEAAFEAMTAEQKIEWLRRAVPPLPEDEDPGTNLILVGSRSMTRKSALCLALDFAIEHKRDLVPSICRQLTNEYRADDQTFSIMGVPFSRLRLCNWAREGLAPGMPAIVPPRVEDLGKALYQDSSQNVHNTSVMNALSEQLSVIQNRVPESQRITDRQAESEIKAHIATAPASQSAQQGLALVLNRSDRVGHFGNSVKGSLTAMWNYIRTVRDPHIQQNLKSSMVSKLREIGSERPCTVGMITRIIDIPTAIDWSLTQTLSHEHLREELRTLAGAINESVNVELDISNQRRAFARYRQNSTDGSNSNEKELTGLIRERFMHTADIEFSMLRGIDRQVVRTQANHVFPESATL